MQIETRLEDWEKIPLEQQYGSAETDYYAFFDENGNNNMNDFFDKKKEKDIYFSLNCVLIKRENLQQIRDAIMELKNKYWQNGYYIYTTKNGSKEKKRVCFHSREIRKQTGPFSKNTIDIENFNKDLSMFINNQNYTILHCCINKEKLFIKHGYDSKDPYELAIIFIFERLVSKILKPQESIECIFESRGKKEDEFLHSHITKIIKLGTYFVSKNEFKKIKGIWFNKKRTYDNQKTYFGLELADLVSYPIYNYCKGNKTGKDFEIVKNKIYNYPSHKGRGLKQFP